MNKVLLFIIYYKYQDLCFSFTLKVSCCDPGSRVQQLQVEDSKNGNFTRQDGICGLWRRCVCVKLSIDMNPEGLDSRNGGGAEVFVAVSVQDEGFNCFGFLFCLF